jgi:hypothetical protein
MAAARDHMVEEGQRIRLEEETLTQNADKS